MEKVKFSSQSNQAGGGEGKGGVEWAKDEDEDGDGGWSLTCLTVGKSFPFFAEFLLVLECISSESTPK